ncbi:hypothetical protein H3146_23445, partial [Streptomyces sp. OF3]
MAGRLTGGTGAPGGTAVPGGAEPPGSGLVATLVRLRFTILSHGSPGLRLARRLCWPLAVAVTWSAVLLAEPGEARHDVLLLVGLAWLLGWTLGPVLASGPGVLRPDFFALLPVGRRRLGAALLAAACVGPGAAATVAATAALGVRAVELSAGTVAVAVLALPPLVLLLVAVSRTVYALTGAAMRSRLGVAVTAVQYGALMASLFVGWLAISATGEGAATLLREGLPGEAAGRLLGFLPTSWPLLAVEAAAEGTVPGPAPTTVSHSAVPSCPSRLQATSPVNRPSTAPANGSSTG